MQITEIVCERATHLDPLRYVTPFSDFSRLGVAAKDPTEIGERLRPVHACIVATEHGL